MSSEAQFHAQGYPIGSGSMESATKLERFLNHWKASPPWWNQLCASATVMVASAGAMACSRASRGRAFVGVAA
jgi:hypothetical protein